MRTYLPLVITALLLAIGCAPAVGDACETSLECPGGAICDTTAPEGYCLLVGCDTDDDCTEVSTCVAFDRFETFCMFRCSSNSDCRDGYTCRPCADGILCDNEERGGFCYIDLPEGEAPYTRATDED